MQIVDFCRQIMPLERSNTRDVKGIEFPLPAFCDRITRRIKKRVVARQIDFVELFYYFNLPRSIGENNEAGFRKSVFRLCKAAFSTQRQLPEAPPTIQAAKAS